MSASLGRAITSPACLSIDPVISFFLVDGVLCQSVDLSCLSCLESFLKFYLKAFFFFLFSPPVFQPCASRTPFTCFGISFLCLTGMLFPAPLSHIFTSISLGEFLVRVFYVPRRVVMNRFYCTIAHEDFVSVMILVSLLLLFFLFLLVLLLHIFSELL